MTLTPEGATTRSEVSSTTNERIVTPGYFETLRIPLIRGRLFNQRDRQNAPLVAAVNQTMARRFWPNQDAIGKRFKIGPVDSSAPYVQVVGIVGDIRQMGLNEAPWPECYFPYWQAESSWMQPRGLVLRTKSDPLSAVTEVRKAVAGIDSEEPFTHAMTMTEIVDHETAQNKTQTILLAGLAVLALLMACIGLHGVLAYMVSQRVQEMGVRMALGASRRDVLALVLRRGLQMAAFGILLGLFIGLSIGRFVQGLLFGVGAADPIAIVSVAILLMVVALVSCLIPARRAASVDPIRALRAE